MSADYYWSAEAVERLRKLWREGLSTAAIGRALGVSKNAVVGKAGRLGLPGRPSPILASGTPRPSRAGKVTLPPAALDAAVVLSPAGIFDPTNTSVGQAVAQPEGHAAARLPPAAPPEARVVAAARPAAPPRAAPIRECCWINGRPAGDKTRFCNAPAVQGRPYCEAHCKAAYVPRPHRQAEQRA